MLVTLIYYIPNAAPTEKNPAPPSIYRRNFICKIIEKGLEFRVCRDVLNILSRRYGPRASALKNRSVPSIFTPDFQELTYRKGFSHKSFKSMLVTLLYYIPNAAPTEKNPAPPRIYRRNFICNIIEKGLGFSV